MVSVLAHACPRCGSPNKRPTFGYGLIVAGVALIAITVAAFGNDARTRRSRNREPARSPSATRRASNSPESSPAVELPAYEIVDDVDLAPKNGHRISVNVKDPDLTDAQCAAIIARLRPRAGREGQVAVRIPLHHDRSEIHGGVPASEQEHFFPLCYDNLDGTGVQEGTARQLQRAFDKKPSGRGGT
ncbi:MAG: hypothetical protein E6J90_38140 [Deltaproteobacteria bacterium]|nr:MAG: hypothetical protein E6J90_38140 [Deltaproteobacteria bacterium]